MDRQFDKARRRSHRRYRMTSWAALVAMAASCTPTDLLDDGAGEASPTSAAAPAASASRPGRPGVPRAVLVTMPATKVRQVSYATAAVRVNDPRLDVLAGAIAELAEDHPEYTQAQLAAAIAELWTLVGSEALPEEYDLSGFGHRAMGRLLGRLVPTLGAGANADAIRAHARAYIAALRQEVDEIRKVSPPDTLDDQLGEGEAFRQAVWARLFDACATRPALAAAVDASVVFTTLGVRSSDSAATILAAHPVEPLRSFFLANVQADGSLQSDGVRLEQLVDDAGNLGAATSRDFADNLFAINAAEEKYLTATQKLAPPEVTPELALHGWGLPTIPIFPTFPTFPTKPPPPPPPPEPKSELEQAIAAAEARQEELKASLSSVKAGVAGSLWLAEELAKLSNDPEFAKDIAKLAKALSAALDSLAKYSESAIKAAKKLAELLDLGATGFKVIGAAIFTGAVVAVIWQMVSILGASREEDPHQVILRQLSGLRVLIQDVRREMHARFDRIDQRLNLIYDQMMSQFALIDWDLGEIGANVEELQAALYSLQSELSRLDRNMYTFFDTVQRVPLLEGITGYLGWFDRLGVPMDFATYGQAENLFYAWGHVHAKDSVQAGAPGRPMGDSALLSELGNYPLATNVNYLRELPPLRFGLPALAGARLANPLTWSIAGESYAQLGEEWPAHQDALNPARLGTLIDDGESVALGLDAIADPALFGALAAHYRGRFNALTGQIAAYTAEFQVNPNNHLEGLGLWEPPTTMPDNFVVKGTVNVPACNGGLLDGKENLPFEFQRWDHSGIAAYLNAHNLLLGQVTTCIDGEWWLDSSQVSSFGTFNTYHLRAYVKVNYKANGQTTKLMVYRHAFDTNRVRSKLIKGTEPNWNPNTAWGYAYDAAKAWPQIYTASWNREHAVKATAAQLAAVEAAVETKLDELQRSYYGNVAAKLRQAGDPLQLLGDQLSGSKRLWESYVTLGMPLTLAQDDHLRQLLFGSQAVLVGSDAGDSNGLLDDVRDIYLYFSLQDEPPQADILPDLIVLGNGRADELEATLGAVITRIVTSGVAEGRELVQGTLLRLYLLAAP